MFSNAEWALLRKCASALPRPHNCSIYRPFALPSEDGSLPSPRFRSTGPPPPEGVPLEELYQQVETWANAVLETWENELSRIEFDTFWADGKKHGFLWEDVIAMAHERWKNKGGIKWHPLKD